MDKTKLDLKEHFASKTESEQKENLQQAVNTYLSLLLREPEGNSDKNETKSVRG